MDDKRLGNALVAIPVLHVLSTSIYIWAFALGFGGNLLAFLAPSDIFSTSITDMVRVYITSLVLPFIMGLDRYLPGYSPPQLPTNGLLTPSAYLRFVKAIQYGILFLVFLAEFYIIYRGGRFNWFLLNIGFIIIAAPTLLSVAERLHLSNFGRDLLYLGPIFLVTALTFGLDAGDTARHRPYHGSRDGLAMCRNMNVIRKAGDMLLAARPSGRKVLIDFNCVIRFRFPATTID